MRYLHHAENLPTAVVLPRTTEDVVNVIKFAPNTNSPSSPAELARALSTVLAVDGGVMSPDSMNRVLK